MKLTHYIILLALALLTLSCNKQRERKNESTNPDSEVVSAPKVSAMELHEKLMSSFSNDWMERESDPSLYPQYYGGSFIDNSGKFVVAVTGNLEENRKNLINILGTDNFNIETVRYSYRDMMLVMDDIDEFLVNQDIPDSHPVLLHFAGAYPDVMDNRVKVILTEVNQSITNSFKKDVSNSPLIIFEQGEIPELY